MEYLQRFGLAHDVFPRHAQGRTFFVTPSYERLERRFAMLARQPGIGVLTGEVGVGKTAAMRNLAAGLPRPDYRVIYLCDAPAEAADLHRELAAELGLRPAHRKVQLGRDLKNALIQMVDEQGVQPVLILDDAEQLPDAVLTELCRLANVAMDSRTVLVLWLVGQPRLLRTLRMKHHAALASRLAARVELAPISGRGDFEGFVTHGLKAAGATTKIISDPAAELLFRVSHGLPREAARLLREGLIHAHERQSSMLDEIILEAVLTAEKL
ncbi:MAG: AAA family ATPase [Candidatus Schekmanbacteria bacterium]|nr:AAA family ATPase [Candidatus Schekmanbacteria bacterium]